MKGVPVRVEVGPRDLAQGLVTVVRRDTGEKFAVPLDGVVAAVQRLADEIQSDMYAAAMSFRDARTHDVTNLDEAIAAAQQRFCAPGLGLGGRRRRGTAKDGGDDRALSTAR